MKKCVTTGGGNRGKQCHFPFKYNGKTYNTCAWKKGEPRPWCSTKVIKGRHVGDQREWGYCNSYCPIKGVHILKRNLQQTTKNSDKPMFLDATLRPKTRGKIDFVYVLFNKQMFLIYHYIFNNLSNCSVSNFSTYV